MSDSQSTGELHSKPKQSSRSKEIVRDIFLWRRKDLSIIVLLVATAIWVVLDVYQFNFITIASWVAMFIVTSLFIWGNILRLLGKEPPWMSSELELSDETAMEMAKLIKEWVEEGVRWMFRVGAESDWSVFAGTVAGLWSLSLVGNYADSLTLLYIGIVVGMTVRVIHEKYDYKIRECRDWFRMQCERFYGMIDEKVLRKIKSKAVGEKKEKKLE